MTGPILINQVQILADGIGSTFVPIHTHTLLRGNDFQEVPHLVAENIPSLFKVIGERLGFILREYDNFIDLRVYAVA
jgi:hypothetical protein